MGFWKRGPSEKTDPELDFLTVGQGDLLRRMTVGAFADAGVAVVPHAQHVAAADGRGFGLWNLAAACAREDEGRWPELIGEHVATVLRSQDAPGVANLPDDEVLANTFLRVMGTSTLPPAWEESHTYARRLAGDLVELLSVDLPDSVALLSDEDVVRLGEGRLREAGLSNLLAEPVESYEVVGEEGAGALHVVEGESFFTASKVLALPELLRSTCGDRDLSHGAVVAVPIRHLVAFHPLDGVDAVGAIQQLTGLAASLFDESPGGVSPFVYWWHEGELTQLSGVDERGELAVMVNDELTGVLNELASRAG